MKTNLEYKKDRVDAKVLNYLERAKKIAGKNYELGILTSFEEKVVLIEIAKLLQREELK